MSSVVTSGCPNLTPQPGRAGAPSGSDIRVPSRVLSAAKQGEAEHPRGWVPLQERRKVCTGTLQSRGCESLRTVIRSTCSENAAAPAQYPSEERRYRPNVTSGCPKRSEGGFPVGTRTITTVPSETKANERGAASHTGDSASFVRAGSAEKFSLPRRTQPESAHARGRRQPDRG